jgi:hypothetical protein
VHPAKRVLEVECHNVTSKLRESQDVKMDKVWKYNAMLGTIRFNNENYLVLDVHFSVPNRGIMGYIMRGERKIDRRVVAVSPTGRQKTLFEFEDDNGFEIINSQNKIMVFGINGEINTSTGGFNEARIVHGRAS